MKTVLNGFKYYLFNIKPIKKPNHKKKIVKNDIK